jgi:hypothetical protein
VTTGTPASVTNAGSSSQAVFDFVIPAGEAGPAGSSGVIGVYPPLTNTGSSTAAELGLSFGSGLGVVGGTLIVFSVPQSSISGLSDTLLLKANATHAHGSITSDGKIGTTSGRIVVTTSNGLLTTAASIALSQLSQSSATTGQVVAWNGSAWAPAAAGGYTLPNATTSTLGGVIVGTGLTVSSGTVSAAVTSVAGRTGAVTIAAADVSGLGTLATQSGTFSGTSSGTNTGDQTITLTGDVTGSGTGSFAATLASTGVAAASYGSASSVATFTVDAKGRLTAAGSTSVAIAASAVTSGTFDAARIPTIAYSSLSGVPSTFAPSAHTHTLSELSQSGATTNQVPQWNGSAWVPGTVSGGGGGSSSASDLTSGTLNDARLSFVPIHPFLLMGG